MSKRTQEEFDTKTQKAKALFSLLREHEIISFGFTGLVADRIWVAGKYKAYHLEDLGISHLSNIIDKYVMGKEPVPQVLWDENSRRIDAR